MPFCLTYCLQEVSAPNAPKALSAEEVGLGGRSGSHSCPTASRTLVSQDILPWKTLSQTLEGTMVIHILFLRMYTLDTLNSPFEEGSFYKPLAALRLTMSTRLDSNSQRSACLCHQPAFATQMLELKAYGTMLS